MKLLKYTISKDVLTVLTDLSIDTIVFLNNILCFNVCILCIMYICQGPCSNSEKSFNTFHLKKCRYLKTYASVGVTHD